MPNELALWNSAKKAIAQAHSVDEVKQIRDKAEAYRYALKLAGEAPAVVRQAEEIKVRAERRAGELLREQPKDDGGRPAKNRSEPATGFPTYAEQGIDKRDASTWQRIAEIPEERFEQFIAETPEITTAGLLKIAKSIERENQNNKPSQPIPSGQFRIFYADPPWQYDNSGFEQSAASHYPTMDTDSICAIPIAEMLAPGAVLFLWATNAFLPDALRVCEAWGFEYKTNLVWIKDKGPGIGWFATSRHELLLIATRGEGVHPKEKPVSWFRGEVSQHSRKPDSVYALIESMYPSGPRLELFARRKREGWENWGNEF